jgi:hypothetical protein
MIVIKNNCSGSIPPGFFSNFFLVLDWLHNSMYTNQKTSVSWTTCTQENLWDNLFESSEFGIEDKIELIVNNFRCLYDKTLTITEINEKIKIYNKYDGWFYNNVNIFFDSDFQSLRDEFNKTFSLLTIKKEILQELEKYESEITPKTIGVAIRIPSHYTIDKTEGIPVNTILNPIDFYNKISEEILYKFQKGNFDKIFVCCDVDYFIELLKTKIDEEKLIFIKYQRVQNMDGDWVEKKLKLVDEYRLVLMDSLLLSKCSYIFGGSSNIFLGSLIINNKLGFEILECLNNYYGL